MLLVGLIVAITFGIHISIANHGCPDDPSECMSYCTKDKDCLTGYCDLSVFYITCKCKGCSNNPIARYKNYGCKTVEEVPPNHAPINITDFHQRIRNMFHGVGLKANVWKKKP